MSCSITTLLYLETWSLTGPGAGLAVNKPQPPLLLSPLLSRQVLGILVYVAISEFLGEYWGFELTSCACGTSVDTQMSHHPALGLTCKTVICWVCSSAQALVSCGLCLGMLGNLSRQPVGFMIID